MNLGLAGLKDMQRRYVANGAHCEPCIAKPCQKALLNPDSDVDFDAE